MTLFGIQQAVASAFARVIHKPHTEDKRELPTEAYMLDWIREASPDAGAHLTKQRAEYHSAGILFVGWIVAAVGNLYLAMWFPTADRIAFQFVLVAAIVGVRFFQGYVDKGWHRKLVDHWQILHERSGTNKFL
jgi:hypothetical protein